MKEATTIKLKEPIPFGSEAVTELRLRPPKAKDFRRLPMEPSIGDMLDFAGQLAGQPKVVMDELGVEDFAEVMTLANSFVPGGRATGQTP